MSPMTGNRKIVGGGLAALALLLTAACGSGSDGGGSDQSNDGGKGGTAASGSPSASPTHAPAKPMAKMPAGTDAGLKIKGRLTVCQGPAGAPFFEGTDSTGSAAGGTTHEKGFDVDLLTLVGERIGAVPVISGYNDEMHMIDGTALKQGVCDIVGGVAPDSPASFPEMSFSVSYFTKDQAILSKQGAHYTSLDALAGKRVGASENDTGQPDALDTYNSTHSKKIKVTRSRMPEEFYGQLRMNQMDAVVTSNARAMNIVAEHPDWGMTASGEFGDRFQARFAVRKDNTALLKQIDAALADAGGNGQYAKAYRTWFGGEPASVPKGE